MENAAHRRVDEKDKILIFVHVPKCGGTSLSRIIEWEYNPKRICTIDPSFFRWSYRRVTEWPAERLARMRVFKGHMPFGLHRRLSAPAAYITILRDPVDRVVSEYYFALTYSLHPEHRMMRRLSLEEYIRSTPYQNVQTKLLAGNDSLYDFLAGECTSETLEEAKKNLAEQFVVVGLSERFDETLALMKIIFGWDIRRYARFNVTRLRPPIDAISPSTQDLIAERYWYDVELNRYARRLFDETVTRHAEAVTKELRLIRRAGKLGRLETIYYRGASAMREGITRIHSAL